MSKDVDVESSSGALHVEESKWNAFSIINRHTAAV